MTATPMQLARRTARTSARGHLTIAGAAIGSCAFVCTLTGAPIVSLPNPAATGPQPAVLDVDGDPHLRLRGTVVASDDDARLRFERIVPEATHTLLVTFQVEAGTFGAAGDTLEFSGSDWHLPDAQWFAREDYIVDHMNDDHIAEMQAMVRHFVHVDDPSPRMLCADPEGMHVRTSAGVHYLPFRHYCDSVKEVALETVYLAHTAMGKQTD
ncbi:MAG: DUF2470 domain-containing protein [Pseudomonadota bacterium]